MKVINGNKIVLGAIEKAGIEIPKSKEEFLKLLDDIDRGFKEKGLRK